MFGLRQRVPADKLGMWHLGYEYCLANSSPLHPNPLPNRLRVRRRSWGVNCWGIGILGTVRSNDGEGVKLHARQIAQ